MPETVADKTIFSLKEVATSIQRTLQARYQRSFWVKAEMNKLNYYKHSGHCYPELLEKENGKIVAQMKACLWRDDYLRIDGIFRQMLNEPLQDGIKILFQARISFDTTHGLSLIILDIDPAYTLGDIEAEKQAAIQQLMAENVFAANKSQRMPLLPKRLAVISVETSKGLADFNKIIHQNSKGYNLSTHLFPSLLQGDKAVASIVNQLQDIAQKKHHFDAVVIVRGGGGDVGLACFNHVVLARAIATFPLPVLTGIGHATNETVAEMVAHYNAITPTKLAEYIIDFFERYDLVLENARHIIARYTATAINQANGLLQTQRRFMHLSAARLLYNAKGRVQRQQELLAANAQDLTSHERQRHSELLSSFTDEINEQVNAANDKVAHLSHATIRAAKEIMARNRWEHQRAHENLQATARTIIKDAWWALTATQKTTDHLNPEQVLKRGYSITRQGGQAVHDAQQIKSSEPLETTLANGVVISTIQYIKHKS